MITTQELLPICRAGDLAIQPLEQNWLIQSIWAHSAVGIIGGAPKCCKSWLGLDMAVSVASKTPCLDHFPIRQKGTALIYLAEDALPSIRSRIESICAHRKLDIKQLDLHVITSSALRLDLFDDQRRLQATLAALHPRILIMDPLVRLHRLDENSASDISNLLGFIRELQRTYDTSIVLVHHASKKQRAQPGQSLRGSSDLHAFGDSNAYLSRKKDRITLTIEHRAAKPPEPFEMELVSKEDGSETHLEISSNIRTPSAPESLSDRTITLLKQSDKPLARTVLRQCLKVNNQRLGETLEELFKQGLVMRTSKGWVLLSSFQQTEKELSQNEHSFSAKL